MVLNKDMVYVGMYYYHTKLDLLNIILPYSYRLTRKELRFMSYYLFHMNGTLSILNKDFSSYIQDKLSITKNSYCNYKFILRKKGYLVYDSLLKGYRLSDKLLYLLDKSCLNFNVRLKYGDKL